MLKKVAVIILILFIPVCVFAMTSRPARTGSVFSQFNLRGVDGQDTHNLGELIAGNIAVVNIWATWCPPCREEIPDLIEVYNKYKQKNVTVVGISVDRDGAAVRDFIAKNKVPYPVLLDDGSVSREFGVRGIPTTLFVNAKGEVVAKKVGYADKAYFSSQIEKLLQK